MSPDVRVSRSARFTSVACEGGHLFYDGAELRLLAGTAARVWEAVDGISTADELAERIAAQFPDDADDVRSDVLAFVEHLAYMGILSTLAPPAEPGYARPDHIGYARDEGAGVLVDMSDGRRRGLTGTGSRVWELVCEHRYASKVVDALHVEYADAPASLDLEVQALLDALVAERFLHRRDGRVAGSAVTAAG